ncbi:MAG: transposase domain-containing protein, partial [Acetivibrio ethanolgignens]
LFYLEREFKDLSFEERKAKSYAIGRKNSLFHTSVDGAKASSIIYSLVETAKANKLNVFQYLYMVLLYMPGCKSGSESIEQLMPWSDFIKEHCSGLIDIETITMEEHPDLFF